MLRSLMAGVSGIRTHTTYLDVVGNNIANVNSVGFKKSITNFADMLYQDMGGAVAPDEDAGTGGIDPKQVGMGAKTAAIETIHTQGNLEYTGNSTDMAIDGDGYFVVKNGQASMYTRAGNFVKDAGGNLVQSGTGYMLQGYAYEQASETDTSLVLSSSLDNINIPVGQKMEAQETTTVGYRCNLDSRVEDYLPMGLDENDVTSTATVDGTSYSLNFSSSLTSDSFITINAGEGGEHGKLNLSFDGINSTSGLPELSYDSVVSQGDGIFDDIGSGEVSYNAETGEITIEETGGGATFEKWSFNIAQILDFDSVTIGDKKFLAQTIQGDQESLELYSELELTEVNFVSNISGAAGEWTVKLNDPVGADQDLEVTSVNNLTKTIDIALGTDSVSSITSTGADVEALVNTNSDTSTILTAFGGTSDTVTGDNGTLSDDTSVDLSGDKSDRGMILWSEEGTQYYASDDSGSPVAIETKDDGTFEIDGTYTFCAGNTATSTIFLGEEGVPVTASGSACHLTLSSDYKSINITNNAEDEQLASVSQRIASVHATKIDIYDSQGNAHVLETSFEKIDNNQWRWRAWFPDESIALSSNTGIIEFNADGLITSESNPGPITANFASLGAEDEEITLDFTGESFNEDEIEGVTQYGSEFTTKGYYQDGYSMGVLEDFSISQDGTITGVYDNGENKALYRMALALFTNPQGLQKVGDTTFMKTSNSGVPQDVPATQGGSGKIAGQSLEMSNVDLSQQFTSLIKGQRGFQANARVVTTSDSVLEELVNLKR